MREFKQCESALADGRKVVLREVTGAAIAAMRSGAGLQSMAAYLAECLVTVDGRKVVVERGEGQDDAFPAMDLTEYDFRRQVRAVRVLSYGPLLEECEFTCANAAAAAHTGGTGLRFKPAQPIDLTKLEGREPDASAATVRHAWGTVVLRPETWRGLCASLAVQVNEFADLLMRRVATIDGKPFLGANSLSGREIRDVRRQMARYDGDAGLSVTVTCPACGATRTIDLLLSDETVLDFFGLA
jgi:hypothetical protein